MSSPAIREFLEGLRAERVIFHPDPGNAGDALIALATFELFEEVGVNWEFHRDDLNVDGRVVLYGGGGNLNPLYDDCADFIEKVHRRAARFILLPHTVMGRSDLLSTLGPNVDILCRERVSLEYVRRAAPHVRAELVEDLAFTLDPEAIVRRELSSFKGGADGSGGFGDRRMFKYVMQRKLSEVRRWSERLLGQPTVLRCFRVDLEATRRALPWDNIDLSKAVSHDKTARSRRTCAETTYEIFRLLSGADEIHTDRLHMAISGALLGKRVRLYPNSYFKNQAVYELSLAGAYPNVEWVGN